jgi:hypothetical protein
MLPWPLAHTLAPSPAQEPAPAPGVGTLGRYRGLDSLTPRRLDVWPLHACSLPASPAILGLPALPRPLIGCDQPLCPIQSAQFAAAHVDAGRAQRPSVALWDLWDGTDGMGRVQDASRHPGMAAWRRGARDDCRHPRLLLSPGWCWAAGRLCAPLPSSALPCPAYHPSAPPPAAGLHSARSLQAALCHGQSALLRDEPVSHRRSQLLALQRFTAPVLSVLGAMAAFVAYPVPRAGPVSAQSRARPWPSTTPPSSSHPVGPRRRFSSPRTAVHRPPLHLLAHDGCPLTPALTTTTTLPSGLRRPKSAFSRWPAL